MEGLSRSEMDRLSGCLARLMPHVRPDSVAITGGVGMQLGMARLGRQGPRDDVADLDLVAASIGAIASTVAGPFLVSHYHVVGPAVPKFMIQLVDPVSRIRVDVFPDLVGSLADARTMAIGEHSIQVLPLERIFEHKVLTLSRATPSAPIDPKQVHGARILGDVLGRPVPRVALGALAPDVYGIEDRCCERCELSSHHCWPLAPKDRIFELLGWDSGVPAMMRAADDGASMGSRADGNQKRLNGQPVVVGVADHNGWAILVTAAAVNGEPTVVDRRRVELIEQGLPSQPYHHETLALSDPEAEKLLRRVERSVAACTALAFDRLSADLGSRYRVASITIREPPLAHLPATVGEVHRSYHAQCRADGMLYHSAICTAARQRDWKPVLHRRGEELAKAAEALQASTHEVERFLNDLRQTLKSPWTAEHRDAFAAAIGRLSTQSRIKI